MSEPLILAAYWLIGFIFLVYLARRSNGGLSVLDFLACAVVAVAWPAVAVIVLFALAISINWLTEIRYFKRSDR